jgi:hypothetical protein
MSELRLAYPVCTLLDKAEITSADLDFLENRVFRARPGESDEIAILLALEHSRSKKCAEWGSFFAEQMVRQVIARVAEIGGKPGALEDWVRHTFCRGGVIASRNEFRVVVDVIEILRDNSPELAAFALEQVHIAIAEGEGPLAARQRTPWVRVSEETLSFVNRILFALGSPAPLAAREVEALFDPARRFLDGAHRTAFDDIVTDLAAGHREAA